MKREMEVVKCRTGGADNESKQQAREYDNRSRNE